MAELKDPKERIKELLSKGYTKIQTIRAMRDEGYGPDVVDNAMNTVSDEEFEKSEEKKPETVKEKPEPKHETKSYIESDSKEINKLLTEIELLKKKVDDNTHRIEGVSSKDLKNYKKTREHEVQDIVNFQAKLEKMHEELREDFKEMSEQMEDFKVQMNDFERKMETIKNVEDDIKKLDLKQIRREIEILKTKEHWIEDNLEKIDVEPVMEKIQEVEHKIDRLKATSPYVIE